MSAKQLAANRRNARRSTGPRSAAGKARSARNALKHGGRAADAVLPGEDPAAYAAFVERTVADLEPVGAVEVALAARVADLSWRLERMEARHAELARAADPNGVDPILVLRFLAAEQRGRGPAGPGARAALPRAGGPTARHRRSGGW